MFWSVLAQLMILLLDPFTARRQPACEKDLEIAALRHQLRIALRRQPRPRLSRWEQFTLTLLVTRLRHLPAVARQRWSRSVLLATPETVLRWHRALVRRKSTFRECRGTGRPRTDATLAALIVRLARKNPRCGYARLHGEFLKRHGVPPTPQRRQGGGTSRALLARHRDQVLACAFFTAETVFLKTLHVVFFIEVGTRRVRLAGTEHPTAAWVAQQARNLAWTLQEGDAFRYLIHDRDAKFPAAFDRVFAAEGLEIVRTPYRAPRANSYVAGEGHLRRMVATYVAHYNEARPHQGLDQGCPIPLMATPPGGVVRRRETLGGLLHEYYREAA